MTRLYDQLTLAHSLGSAGLNVVPEIKSSNLLYLIPFSSNLETLLSHLAAPSLLLVGFTANECIDATARDAVSKGFSVFVAGDGTATFDLRDENGRLIKADRIHRLTLLNISAFSATVVSTAEIISSH